MRKFGLVLFFGLVFFGVKGQDSMRRVEFYDFSDSVFKEAVDFSDSQFDSILGFTRSQFYSTADFSKSHFDKHMAFFFSQFYSSASFAFSHFNSYAVFMESHFNSLVSFHKTHFDSSTAFIESHFASSSNFNESHFNSTAYFTSTCFVGVVNFRNVNFSSDVSFVSSHFTSTAKFSGSKFGGKVNFSHAVLPEFLFFDKITQIEQKIDFSRAVLDSGRTVCHIDMTHSDLSKIKLRYSRFQLFFSDRTLNNDDKSNVYEQLLKTQKDYGFTTSYEKLDKEYQQFQYEIKNRAWVGDLERLWWDYGYDKQLIFWNTLKVFSCFWLINLIFFRRISIKIYRIENIWKSFKRSDKTVFSIPLLLPRFMRRRNGITHNSVKIYPSTFVYSLFYTFLVFFGLRMSIEQINFRNKAGVLYLFLQYVAGIVCLAYLANYIIVS